MKKELMNILCCPTCKEDLTLITEKEKNGEILEGKLKCKKCDVVYTIEDSIPNLLPKES